ncbi:hypothetical protein FYZ48_07725 [Gimesia chilikensis]|uniref:hypothetical protein n=1 Tax=Gimesia chilikensis TaxID=2605989 RepID=UPI0011EF787C|nr:hypothetical protein [Gimesia chilikensis]KAA0139814.1 hypothetical protein FYZ48_07725 [Gimesia chilikensis]
MQLTECYRRGIFSPCNQDAEDQLRFWYVDHPLLVNFISLNNDDDYSGLWDLKVFDKINGLCDSMIDDYEEEVIEPDQLYLIVRLIDQEYQNVSSPSLKIFFKSFRELLEKAIENQKPVFFIF